MEEIATVLGIRRDVKWRMSEGRRHLKNKLARLGIGHE